MNNAPPIEVAYHTPRGKHYVLPNYFTDAVLLCFPTAVLMIYFAIVVPHCREIFQDFRIAPSLPAEIMLRCDDILLISFGALFFIPVPFFFAAVLIPIRFLFHRQGKPRILRRAIKLLLLFLPMAIVLAVPVVVPVLTVMHSIRASSI